MQHLDKIFGYVASFINKINKGKREEDDCIFLSFLFLVNDLSKTQNNAIIFIGKQKEEMGMGVKKNDINHRS